MALIDFADSPRNDANVIDLAKEANHRISNHLSLIASMVQVQASSVARGPEMLSRLEVRGLLRETAGKINSVAHLHRKLAEQGQGDQIELGGYLIESCAILVSSLALKERVGFVQQIEANCFVSPQQAQAIGLIANEVIMNAVKHAHPTGLPVQMRLACRRLGKTGFEIEIEDDGIGLPEHFDYKSCSGVGFTLIRALADTLNAKLTVESDSLGTSFRMTVLGREHFC
jgi:two-component sensor histidine kinase